jgi:hypothetical protein
MPFLVHVQARPISRLLVEFSDGVRAELDLSSRLFGPVFEPLRDPSFFAQVTLDAFGVPCWPNGADLAPDALYSLARASDGNELRHSDP